MRIKQIVSWRDMLLALDDEGQLWRLRIDPVTNKATVSEIPLTEVAE